MSHALLLRLFLSPSFFSVHVALQYLMRYADNIGITYYLTRRLAGLDPNELRDVWGCICHLLVTRPSKSRSLECFVVSMSEQSTHLAMFTLWFMQAYLGDLSTRRPGSASIAICQRVVHQCHEIIFGDVVSQTMGPYPSLNIPTGARFSRTKVNHHVEPAWVGMGCILGGSIAMPTMALTIGACAIEQGRCEEDAAQSKKDLEDRNANKQIPFNDAVVAPAEDDQNDDEVAGSREAHSSQSSELHDTQNEHTRTPLSRRKTVSAARTSPALPLRKTISKNSYDPFGQLDGSSIALVSLPSQSSPSLPTVKRIQRKTSGAASVDVLLQRYNLKTQILFLQGHYCRTEIRFISALERISNRLLVVPKPARVSALRAELISLNHRLPAEVCMPMWCSSTDSPGGLHGFPKAHHRIVRIPPGESVVLNSAERAPYLIIIEILNTDLDFDPSRRSNKEVLRKLVTTKHGPANLKRSFSSQDAAYADREEQFDGPSVGDAALGEDTQAIVPLHGLGSQINQSSSTLRSIEVEPEEEIDLVEQIYGSDLSVRQTPDLSESLVIPVLKNKDLDVAAWSKSPPPSPFLLSNSTFSMTPTEYENGLIREDDGAQVAGRSAILSLDEYSERMRTAAVMLAQLNANVVKEWNAPAGHLSSMSSNGNGSWLPSNTWLSIKPPTVDDIQPAHGSSVASLSKVPGHSPVSSSRLRLQASEAAAIKDRIMQEMLSLEKERMERMQENNESDIATVMLASSGRMKTAEDEAIIRRELDQVDPSAVIFQESWATKKSRIKQSSPYGHLASWDCVSVIVKTGADLRQEQLAVQIIREFQRIWSDEKCQCWVRPFQIVITSGSSGLVETITDAVSIHSIKKAEYARRFAQGRLGHVTLLDHFISSYGDPSSAKFARAQRNFAKSLAGYSIITYLLQIKDRHNGNILLHRDGHLIHIDFGFILSNTPGNIGFEAAPFKLPLEYMELLGGTESAVFTEFKRLFHEGFDAARKHCDRILTIVELMQKDSCLPCFNALGEETAQQLRDRFQLTLTRSAASEYYERLILTSMGSHWTRLYDSYQYYAQSIL